MHVCQLVYKELNNLLPVKRGFIQTAEVHKYGTRQEKKLYLHCHRTNYYSMSISYTGVKVYNLLPDELKQSKTIHMFKRKVKTGYKTMELTSKVF